SIPRLRKISGTRGFRAPGGLTVPILGVLISLTLFSIMTRERFIAAMIALVVGAILFGIARASSKPSRKPVAE
ncbi:MAG TPA: amino acid permease, partial [Thermoanaerobaculia bacterium]|nr:amino acid permease [Thermoanaerobaculia bacterium]